VSGSYVLADEKKKADLRNQCPSRRLLAIEMEAGGIKAMLEHDQEHNSFLLVKAFSDWAGDDKDDASIGKDLWHPYACKSAAVCTSELITECLGARLSNYRQQPDAAKRFQAKASSALTCFIESCHDLPGSFQNTARDLFLSAVHEAEQIAASLSWSPRTARDISEFRARIGQGQQFLLRARPIFGGASQIMAFSVDTVSTFWTAEEMKPLVKTYIDSQGGGKVPNEKVIRTFVFTTPEEAHRYARRLDYHAARFPNTFVCSAEHYLRLLREVVAVDESAATEWTGSDFALLDYELQDGDVISYFADLEASQLAVRRIVDDVVAGVQIAHVRKLCEDFVLRCATPGNTTEICGVPILKWLPSLWEDKGRWENILAQMFDERTADVYHVTGFTVGNGPHYAAFRRSLARLKNDLWTGSRGRKSLTRRYGLRGIGLTKLEEYGDGRPRDRLTKGRLHYVSQGLPKDVIIVRVADQADLEGFLADEEHTRLRLELFLELAKSNATLDEVLRRHGIKSFNDLKKLGVTAEHVYEEIENAAALWRVDLQNDEMLDEIVEWQPRPF
jgi:hypothetical protein